MKPTEEKRVTDAVARLLKQYFTNANVTTTQEAMYYARQCLDRMISADYIRHFKFEVDVKGEAIRQKKIGRLMLPGDPIIDADGKITGIVLSSPDAAGFGTILAEPGSPAEVVVHVTVQPTPALEYLTMEVRVQ